MDWTRTSLGIGPGRWDWSSCLPGSSQHPGLMVINAKSTFTLWSIHCVAIQVLFIITKDLDVHSKANSFHSDLSFGLTMKIPNPVVLTPWKLLYLSHGYCMVDVSQRRSHHLHETHPIPQVGRQFSFPEGLKVKLNCSGHWLGRVGFFYVCLTVSPRHNWHTIFKVYSLICLTYVYL